MMQAAGKEILVGFNIFQTSQFQICILLKYSINTIYNTNNLIIVRTIESVDTLFVVLHIFRQLNQKAVSNRNQ